MSTSLRWSYLGAGALGCLLFGCNLTPARTTGGVDLPSRGGCPRGLAVVSSDFLSSEVALLSPPGDVASAAFISSSSGSASNLAAPFSGDLTLAASPERPGELVVIDRFGTNVLSFVDIRTASVLGQLPVGTGFEANPQGYLAVSEHQAYVPRLSDNPSPGREPFDAGSDVLVIDPALPSIVRSLPMPRQEGFLPNPVAVARFDDTVLVTLQHARPDYSGMADSELVAIAVSDESIAYRLPLAGLQNCGRAELIEKTLVVACASFIDPSGAAPDVSGSGIVVLDATEHPPREVARFAALDLVGGPIQSSVEPVTDKLVLFKSQTAVGTEQDNQLFLLDLESGQSEMLGTAARGAGGQGYGIAFGGMSCGAACGDPCLVADASRGRLLRFHLQGEGLEQIDDVWLDGAGLPPLGLTPFF